MSDTWQDEVNAAQRRCEAAEAEKSAADRDRNDLFKRLHARGIMPMAMSRATRTEANPDGLHRTWIQRIVTPPQSSD